MRRVTLSSLSSALVLLVLLVSSGGRATAFVRPYAHSALLSGGTKHISVLEGSKGGCNSFKAGVYETGHRQRLGVRYLKAGLDFMPFPEENLFELAKQVQDLGVRNHMQSGFIGGSVGVIGTIVAIQMKIGQVRELTQCPYCRSSGQLPCALCFGLGSVQVVEGAVGGVGGRLVTRTCPACLGKTYVTCINCKGDGRAMPNFLNKKVSRDPESEIEDVGYG
ncbi:unnamed protein product [Discosporangium mesarthrocarpum]